MFWYFFQPIPSGIPFSELSGPTTVLLIVWPFAVQGIFALIKSASKKSWILIGWKRLFSSNRHQRNRELWLVENDCFHQIGFKEIVNCDWLKKKTRIFCSHQIVVCGKICHFTGVTSSFEQKYVWRKLKVLNKQLWENVLHYRKPMKCARTSLKLDSTTSTW